MWFLDFWIAGEAHIHILYPGDLIVFPRGLMHFELNVGTEEAFYISALNSQNPGTLVSLFLFFNLLLYKTDLLKCVVSKDQSTTGIGIRYMYIICTLGPTI